jgi:hypothetical protein
MYSYDNALKWEVDAVKQGPNLMAAAETDIPAFTLYPGVSVLLDFDPQGAASIIRMQGEAPVFASWFDEHNQLMGSEVLRASKQLPAGVAELILSGLNTEVLKIPYAYGWYVTSQLTLVNPNALIGMGAVIIPDAPIRIRSKITSSGYGLISGQDMVQANRIIKDEKSVSAGVKTVMPSNIKTIAVLALKENKNDPFNGDLITVKIKTLVNNVPEFIEMKASTVIDGSYEAAVLFDLPADTGYNYSVVYTNSGIHTSITGVMGLAEGSKYVAENWKEIVIQPALPYPYTVPQASAKITIEKI